MAKRIATGFVFSLITIHLITAHSFLYADWQNYKISTDVDSNEGMYSSLVIKNGIFQVAYQQIGSDLASYVKYTKTSDFSTWSTEAIAINGINPDNYKYIALGVDSNNKQYVVFYDSSTWDILCSSATNGTNWSSFMLIDDCGNLSANYGVWTSMAIGTDNKPQISYYRYRNMAPGHALNYATFTFTSGWATEEIDIWDEGSPRLCTDITVDSSNQPHISYVKNGNVYYIYWAGVWSSPELVHSGNCKYTSIALDSNNVPYIVFYDGATGQLKCKKRINAGIWADSTIETIAPAGGDVDGYRCSIVIDTSNNTHHIVYYNITDNTLKYAKTTTDSWPNGSWPDNTKETICVGSDPTKVKRTGLYCSLALDSSGTPYVTYYDANGTGGGDLKYAKWVPPSSTPSQPEVPSSTSVYVTRGSSYTIKVSPPAGGRTITVGIPENTFSSSFNLAVLARTDIVTTLPTNQKNMKVANLGVEITGWLEQPQKDITITIEYNDSDISGFDENKLAIAYYDSGVWKPIFTSSIDPSQNKIVGTTRHLSIFALVEYSPGSPSTKDIKNVYCYPVPLYLSKGQQLKFMNVPSDAEVEIYTINGIRVKNTNADSYGDVPPWDGKDENSEYVGTGTYIVHVKDTKGNHKVFKIMVIR